MRGRGWVCGHVRFLVAAEAGGQQEERSMEEKRDQGETEREWGEENDGRKRIRKEGEKEGGGTDVGHTKKTCGRGGGSTRQWWRVATQRTTSPNSAGAPFPNIYLCFLRGGTARLHCWFVSRGIFSGGDSFQGDENQRNRQDNGPSSRRKLSPRR